jgi:hypothetical protein
LAEGVTSRTPFQLLEMLETDCNLYFVLRRAEVRDHAAAHDPPLKDERAAQETAKQIEGWFQKYPGLYAHEIATLDE